MWSARQAHAASSPASPNRYANLQHYWQQEDESSRIPVVGELIDMVDGEVYSADTELSALSGLDLRFISPEAIFQGAKRSGLTVREMIDAGIFITTQHCARGEQCDSDILTAQLDEGLHSVTLSPISRHTTRNGETLLLTRIARTEQDEHKLWRNDLGYLASRYALFVDTERLQALAQTTAIEPAGTARG